MTALPFADRDDAARRLAVALAHLHGSRPLVLAIPRGAVPMGRVLATALGGDLDVVLVRKLGAPGNPELAIGAVDEHGRVHLASHAALTGADAAYIRRETERQLALIRDRRRRYTPDRPPLDAAGRTVIVVDDGLATGSTMIAALGAARAAGAAHLVCAVPVAARDSLERVRPLADEVVCLAAPLNFHAVGQYYDRFDQVSDEQVVALLAASRPGAGEGRQTVTILCEDVATTGDLVVPDTARGLILFAHGSGSSRHSPRNRQVAATLEGAGFATLLMDLLTPDEDADPAARFDIDLLAHRLDAALRWARHDARVAALPVGLFGSSTGAAAALRVAAARGDAVRAVVSRGGRPDLAGDVALARVQAPTLLIVGGADREVLALNRQALAAMTASAELVVVPGATHLFEEPGALEQVARLAVDWFARWLTGPAPAVPMPARS
ncbi:phosphoribosyltransferase family protein [Rehaibacterium terrae]|jgi:putative phosphoribosyl transferase|uniref:Putative phosphoribosyltransferase/putative alpha/beta-hydrolase family hydrolase n=1 Tax=Rehaibacterium terrae TaxID=1341696 RepID=A0A7W7Y185_9GAMM|nr:phosphoribosyltransferase family protein [Rehaibacterium terrae]MBB5016003.1 putative phosphoribosyltransferase/putative alpha/beta-hydrolase family hydrolase [Rehaibacterium terrae]